MPKNTKMLSPSKENLLATGNILIWTRWNYAVSDLYQQKDEVMKNIRGPIQRIIPSLRAIMKSTDIAGPLRKLPIDVTFYIHYSKE